MLPVNNNIEGIVMDMRKKLVICGIITILFDMEAYVIAYSATDMAIPNVWMLFLFRYLFMIPFYAMQIGLLYYAIKLQSRLLWFLPFYWGMEIYRLVFRNLAWFTQSYENNGILNFLYKHITAVFWTADYALTYRRIYIYESDFPSFSVLLLVEDIVKLAVSLGALFISCKYVLRQHKTKTQTEEAAAVCVNSHISIANRDTYPEIKTKFIRSGLLIIICNIVAFVLRYDGYVYLLFYPVCYGVTLILRYVVAISYFVLQIRFLYYAIKMGGNIIYFFPFHWAIEIWRLAYGNIVWENLHYLRSTFGHVVFRYITRLFWLADWLPYTHAVFIDYHDWPLRIQGEDIIKLVTSVVAFIIACRYAIMQYRKGKAA